MEITVEKINARSDAYQLFLDSIRNESTKKRYQNLLYTFLKLVPNKIYTDSLVKHGVSDCKTNSEDLDLEGDVDANFKEGDILVLTWFPSEPQRWIEVFREQTP